MIAERLIKLTSAVCCLLLAISLIMAWNHPATGYEASIYTSTPVIFWISSIFCYLCGVSSIIHQIWTGNIHRNRIWMIGIILLVLNYAALMSLQIIRGYVLWSPGDVFSHLGMSQELLVNGTTDSMNFYPVTHILAVQSHYASGMSIMQVFTWIPFVFELLYVLFIGLLAKCTFSRKEAILFVLLFALIPFHEYYFNMTPNHLGTLFIPFVLYLIVRRKSYKSGRFNIIFILTLILLGPLHPIIVTTSLILLITIQLSELFIRRFRNPGINRTGSDVFTWMLMAIWGYTWISSFYFWRGFILNIRKIMTELTSTQLDMLQGRMSYAEGLGYNLAEYFFKEYGGIVLLIIFAVIDFFIIWRKIKTDHELRTLGSFYLPLGIFALTIVALFLVNLGFGPTRFMPYIVILCVLFGGHILYMLFEKYGGTGHSTLIRVSVPLIFILVLSGLWTHSMLKLYPSPYIFMSSGYTPSTDIEGMDWYFEQKDPDIIGTSLSIPPWRFSEFLLTPEEMSNRTDIPEEIPKQLLLPVHFGYDKESTLGIFFETNTYLLLNQRDRVLYVDIFPELSHLKYSQNDFAALENDTSVSKLYSNGGFDVYFIKSASEQT